jgi:glycine cleavage system H protein
VVVGVTAHAQEALGDVVYVELPKVGDTLTAGKPFGVVESTKAESELFAPISGKVTKVNSALADEPATLNSDPYGAGWIVEVEPSDPAQLDGLMDADGYNDLLAKTAT